MKKTLLIGAGGIALMMVACGSNSQPAKSEPTNPVQGAAPAAAPAVPPDIQEAAEAALGSETEVLAHGNLALNEHEEVLAVNRMKPNPERPIAGTVVTRAVVIEKDGAQWKEVFRCDEHLKNTSGYLGGTPLAGVSAWRLQYEQDAAKGLQMYFTPVDKPAGGYVLTLGVRWNPKVKRYQTLDRSYEHFQTEVASIETPQSQLRQ